MSDECYFCDEHVALEEHHVVPRKVVQSPEDTERVDHDETFTLCANCHYKMHECLDYLIRFYTDKMRSMEHGSGFAVASDL